jgi:hypothetical protein
MDCRLQARTKAMVEELAREHQQELADAGTLVDLEELTCQIGDEVTRLLTERELVRRGQHVPHPSAACPDCGQDYLPMAEPDPVVLTGLRGQLAYAQPRHYCDRCRRSFFPSGRTAGPARAEYRHHQGVAKGGVGRSQ